MARISNAIKKDLSKPTTQELLSRINEYEKELYAALERDRLKFSVMATDTMLNNIENEYEKKYEALELIRSYIHSKLIEVQRRRFFKDKVTYKDFYIGAMIRHYEDVWNTNLRLRSYASMKHAYPNLELALQLVQKLIDKR